MLIERLHFIAPSPVTGEQSAALIVEPACGETTSALCHTSTRRRATTHRKNFRSSRLMVDAALDLVTAACVGQQQLIVGLTQPQ